MKESSVKGPLDHLPSVSLLEVQPITEITITVIAARKLGLRRMAAVARQYADALDRVREALETRDCESSQGEMGEDPPQCFRYETNEWEACQVWVLGDDDLHHSRISLTSTTITAGAEPDGGGSL